MIIGLNFFHAEYIVLFNSSSSYTTKRKKWEGEIGRESGESRGEKGRRIREEQKTGKNISQ